jgi:outer membrane protein OmpA-like peptidoglycan-associated protein
MEEIADVIMRNPQLTSIEIQGHTDDRGGREHNQDLSQRRADSVRAWLVQHGVEAIRLQAMGYGQTRPLVPNITSANRARNRRVQFVVQ